MTTLGQIIQELKRLKAQKSVYKTLASFLAARYTMKDDGSVVFQIKSEDGSPVEESVILDVIDDLELQIDKLQKEIKTMETEEFE